MSISLITLVITWPTWVQLVFGQTLVFDRRNENDGQPVAPVKPEVAAR